MNALTDWLSQPLAYRLGWTLLHFLWQGSIIALALAIAQLALKKRSAEARYAAACLAFGVMALAPFLTFISLPATAASQAGSAPLVLTGSFSVPTVSAQAGWPQDVPATGSIVAGFLRVVPRPAEPVLPWLTAIWLAGVCILFIRMIGGWCRVQRLSWQQTDPLGEPWLSNLKELQQRLEISRSVRLLQSALVEVPTLIGWLKPVILLPASTLTGLSPAQLESILAHELAHIRRNDYLVNVVQRIIETVLFYHPAIWWVSESIRREREHCCDDLVVQVCGDRVGYARALVCLEGLRVQSSDLALAASDGSLLQRIQRVLQKAPPGQSHNWRRIVILLIVGGGLLAIAAWPRLLFAPELYASTVRIQMSRTPTPTSQNDATVEPDPYESDWLQTELKKITSKTILYRVIKELNLGTRFNQRYGRGGMLRMDEIYLRLRKNIEVRTFPRTSVVEVKVFSEEPSEAAWTANRIAEVYGEVHLEAAERSRLPLRNQLRDMQERLRTTEGEMDELRRELVGPVRDDEFDSTPADALRVFERQRAETEIKLANFESLLAELSRIPKEELANAMPNTSFPDARLVELLAQRDAAEAQLIQLTFEYTSGHPTREAGARSLTNLNDQISQRAAGILQQLEIEVNRHRAQIEFLEKKADEARRADADLTARYRPYFTLKRDHESMRRLYETLQLREMQESADFAPRRESFIRIVDQAVPAERPARRAWLWRN